jgi:phosphohistidine phosphatase
MKTLLILRHAKSSWAHTNLADHDRPLNKRGKQDAPRMGQLLKNEDLTPELIITSSARRALATAELAASASGYEDELQVTRRFYLAGPETYLEVLRGVGEEVGRVMVVGHNPGMAELIDWLTGAGERFTTANIAHIELPINTWSELNDEIEGKLLNLWRPKELS